LCHRIEFRTILEVAFFIFHDITRIRSRRLGGSLRNCFAVANAAYFLAVSGSRREVSGSARLNVIRWNMGGGTREVKHGRWNTGGGTREVEHGGWNTGGGTREVEHGRWNTGGGTREVEHERWNTGGGTREVEHGRWNTGG